jgi:hypothetical protein
MQAAQVIGQMPSITPVADELLKSAGFVDKNGGEVVAQPAQAAPVMPPVAPIEPPMLADGSQTGIETPTGIDNAQQPV